MLGAPAGHRNLEPAPRLRNARAAFSPISPAPRRSTRAPSSRPKTWSARSTATLTTLTGPDVTAVWVWTCFAAWKAFWKSRFRTGPADPLSLGGGVGLLHRPKISVSPSIWESSPRGHLEEVADGVGPGEVEPEFLELGRVEPLPRAEGLLDPPGRALRSNRVELDPVAGVQDRELPNLLEGPEPGRDLRLPLGIEGEPLPDFERSRLVGRADDEQAVRVHVAEAPRAGTGPSSGWRSR